MNRSNKIVIIIGILIIPNLLFCQKNQIGIQVGPVHYYFDQSPQMNKNDVDQKALTFLQFFHESWGLNYSRNLNSKSGIGLEVEL